MTESTQPHSHHSIPRVSHGTSLVSLIKEIQCPCHVTDCPRNPTLEEQALARIHRIGQTCEVTTVRFYIRDSFEEVSRHVTLYYVWYFVNLFALNLLTILQQVMRLQASKKQLAGLLLSHHDGGDSDDKLAGLHVSVYLGSTTNVSPPFLLTKFRT